LRDIRIAPADLSTFKARVSGEGEGGVVVAQTDARIAEQIQGVGCRDWRYRGGAMGL